MSILEEHRERQLASLCLEIRLTSEAMHRTRHEARLSPDARLDRLRIEEEHLARLEWARFRLANGRL